MARAIIEVLGDSKSAQKALQDVGKQTSTLNSTLSSITKTAFSVVGGFLAFRGISAVFRETVAAGFDMNRVLELSNAKWVTLLGSQEAAAEQLKWMEEFAARTPFAFEELDAASTRMKAYGFSIDQTRILMRVLGDTTAALGGGSEVLNRIALALGQMQAKGKIASQEMRQLGEQGVPAWEILARAMGLSVSQVMKLVEKGELLADDVIPVLVGEMDRAFGGAMENQMATLTGRVSTLKDEFRFLMADVVEPLFTWFRDVALPAVAEKVELLKEGFAEDGLGGAIRAAFGPEIADAIEMISNILGTLWSVVGGFFGFVIDNHKFVLTALAAIAAHFVWIRIQAIAAGIVKTVFGIMGNAAILMGSQFLTAKRMIDAATLGLTALITVGFLLIANWDKVKYYFINFGGSMKALFFELKAVFFDLLASTIGWIVPGLKKGWQEAADAAREQAQKERDIVDQRVVDYEAAAAAKVAAEKKAGAELEGLANKETKFVWPSTAKAAGKATEEKIDYLEDFDEAWDRSQDSMLTSFKRGQEDMTTEFKREQRNRLDDFEDAQEDIERTFERSQQDQLDAFKRGQKEQLDALRERHESERDMLDAGTDRRIKDIEAQKDAIRAEEAAEKQAKRHAEMTERVAEAQQALDEARSVGDIEAIAEAEKDLTEVLAEQAEMLVEEARRAELDRLDALIDGIRAERDLRMDALEDAQELESRAFEDGQAAALREYERQLEDLKTAKKREWEVAKTAFEDAQKEQATLWDRGREDQLTRFQIELDDLKESFKGKREEQEAFLADWNLAVERMRAMVPSDVAEHMPAPAPVPGTPAAGPGVEPLQNALDLALQGAIEDAADILTEIYGLTREQALENIRNVRAEHGLPGLAGGGTATRGGFAIVGERGPEIAWLERGARVAPLNAAGGTNVTVNVTGNTIASDYDIQRIGRGIVRELRLAGVTPPR